MKFLMQQMFVISLKLTENSEILGFFGKIQDLIIANNPGKSRDFRDRDCEIPNPRIFKN